MENTIGRVPVQQWNTVAEIRGSERPGQVVILGAHLDSWDLGTGTTDNGTGSMVVLEAARALAQSGLKPKRTIRFILFSGEEEGLLGSRAYAAAHAAEADSIQAVLVLDNGTGAITGQALQGRDELAGLWHALLAPVASLGADSVRDGEQVRHRPPRRSFPTACRASTSTSIPAGTPTPTTRRATPTTRRCPSDLKPGRGGHGGDRVELANLPDLLPARPEARAGGGTQQAVGGGA